MYNSLFFCRLSLAKYLFFQKIGDILSDCGVNRRNQPVLSADYVQPCQNLEPWQGVDTAAS